MTLFSKYIYTDKVTGSKFIGEYAGGPTINPTTGKRGLEICLMSKTGQFKWVAKSQCVKVN